MARPGRKRKTDVVITYTGEGVCPYCGSTHLTTLPESEKLEARVGCLACDRWLTPETEKRRTR